LKITLVRPSMHGRRTSDAMEPLAFAILRALTPADVEVVVYDERVESIPLDAPTDLVAMTVETYTARRAFQLATAYRRVVTTPPSCPRSARYSPTQLQSATPRASGRLSSPTPGAES
jgi:hypothetical protein